MKRTRNRKCDHCHKGYWRVNKAALWTGRNPGHTKGWQKTTVKLCNDCMSLKGAYKSLMMWSLRIVKGGALKAIR